jgi:transposase-like protein
VIALFGTRRYLRYNLSYRDVEELLVERGMKVDHVTVFRWVQRFTPLLADAARFTRHAPGDRWYVVDETYVKVNGSWRYVYRAIDQYGQVIDVLVAPRRDAAAARRFFSRALATLKVTPSEVVTDAAAIYPAVLDDLIPFGVAPRRAVRQQSDGGRSWSAETPATRDARAAYRPNCTGDHCWTWPGSGGALLHRRPLVSPCSDWG